MSHELPWKSLVSEIQSEWPLQCCGGVLRCFVFSEIFWYRDVMLVLCQCRFSQDPKTTPKLEKNRGCVMNCFYSWAWVLRKICLLFLFTCVGSAISGSLGIMLLLISSPKDRPQFSSKITQDWVCFGMIWAIQLYTSSIKQWSLGRFGAVQIMTFLRNLRANGLQEHDCLRWAPKIYKWRLAQKCVPT